MHHFALLGGFGAEGIDIFQVDEEALCHHRAAFGNDSTLAQDLEAGGEYAWHVRGEEHMWTPDSIAKLQHATRADNYRTYKEYAQIINDQSRYCAKSNNEPPCAK